MSAAGKVGRVARVVAIATLVAGAVMMALVSQARAAAERQLWRLGESFTSLTERADPTGDPRTLVVNGAEVVIRSDHASGDVAAALDRAEDACAGYQVGERKTTMRAANADHGFVACFHGLRDRGTASLIHAGWTFVTSGDMSGMGPFDYTYVRASAGGVHELHVRLPHLDIEAMFPDDGDAPGLDVREVPRPPGGVRILSAFDADQPYQVAIYRSHDGTPRQIAEGYRQQLGDAGWRVDAGQVTDARVSLVATRASEMVAIVLRSSDGGVTTTIGAGL